jgi:opacity protein-like surface antigen
MPQIRVRVFVSLVVLSCAASSSAQDRPRGFISVNGGYQASTTEFDDSFTFSAHQETGTSRVTYPIDAGPSFDAGGGVRLWRGLGVGVAVSRFTRDGSVRATSSVPHPFFLQQHREVAGEADRIRREETAIHVQAQYSVPIGRRLHVTLMGGPSVLQVNQALVIDVNYTEEYPYDTAAFSGVDSTRQKGTKSGFNAGADVRWMFTRHIGAGAVVRFSRATIDLDAAENRTVSVDVGGAQAGAGLRIGF